MNGSPREGSRQDAPRRRRLAAGLSMAVGAGILGAKWAAYLATGSHAILSDALESIVNIAATAFALYSLFLSDRPPDPKYPYGYGKITLFSAGFEGGLILLAALAILYEAVQGFVRREALTRPGLGVGILIAAGAVNFALGLWLVAEGRRTRSIVLTADGRHVLSDSYTSLGVVVGVSLAWLTGWSWLDPLMALGIGLMILNTGRHLVHDAVRGLLDRADPALLDRIVSELEAIRTPGWIDLHNLRAWRAGDRTFVDFHLVVPPDWTVLQLHQANDACLERLRSVLGPDTEVYIHFDPLLPHQAESVREGAWDVGHAVRVPNVGDVGNEFEPVEMD